MRTAKTSAALFAALMLAVAAWPQRGKAATCYGSSCNGLDPVSTGCSADATVISSGPVNTINDDQLGTVYYKWSSTCQAGYAVTVTEDNVSANLIEARIWDSSTNYTTIGYNTSTVTSPLLSASSYCDLYATALIRIGPVGTANSGTGNAEPGCAP